LYAALRDPLTDLYNRRHFDERFTAECAAARRHKRPCSLLLIDIDDFKVVNDSCGHQVGDDVLRIVGKALQETLRQEDEVFRFGGEEFAIIARETAVPGALELAERLRARIRRI